MSELTPGQQRVREQIEELIGAVAPALDLILAAGERVSRIVEPEDHEHYPVRPGPEPAQIEAPQDSAGAGDRVE